MASIRVADEPAFVLHSIPYKETSLILDVFTRQYGRMALIAKGAKRPHSTLRPVLQRFQPLLVSWSVGVGGWYAIIGGRCLALRILSQ
jgi:DNA repair protein RecO (recombination protein O)